jgi:hypothetical protein
MSIRTCSGDTKKPRKCFPIVFAAAIILAVVAPLAVHAEDYQFRFLVRVQVKNLHPYANSVFVHCGLKDVNGNVITTDVAHSPADNGVLDATGSYSGTLAYSIKMFNPADATKAKSYACGLHIQSSYGSHPPESCPDPMSIFYCLKPGTPSTLKVEGPIP